MTDFDWMQKRRPARAAEQPPKRDLTEDWPSEGYATYCWVQRIGDTDYPFTGRDMPGYNQTPPKPPEPEETNILDLIRRCERMLDAGDTDLHVEAPLIILELVTVFREELEPRIDMIWSAGDSRSAMEAVTDLVTWWQEQQKGAEGEEQ